MSFEGVSLFQTPGGNFLEYWKIRPNRGDTTPNLSRTLIK